MVHKFLFRRTPRIVLLPIISAGLVGGSIALIALVQPLVGFVALAISAWLSYHLLKFFSLHMRSEIRTNDEELVCETSMGEKSVLDWSSISHAGRYLIDGKRRFLFVYDEGEDQLVSIPYHYEDMEGLDAEIQDRVATFLELSGPPGGLPETLKEIVAPEEAGDE